MSFIRSSIGAYGKDVQGIKEIAQKTEKKRKLAAETEVDEPRGGGIRKHAHAEVVEQPSFRHDSIKLREDGRLLGSRLATLQKNIQPRSRKL